MVKTATHGKWQGEARRGSRHGEVLGKEKWQVARHSKEIRHGKVLGKEQVKAVLVCSAKVRYKRQWSNCNTWQASRRGKKRIKAW